MNVGFTGTREGMTYGQVLTVFTLLRDIAPAKVHHGDCVGADHDFHLIAAYKEIPIRIHPPDNPKHRAYMESDDIAEEKDYHSRNHDIVDESCLLIATPKEAQEQWRSGTWSTIRYAKRKNKPVIIVWPNGLTEEFNT